MQATWAVEQAAKAAERAAAAAKLAAQAGGREQAMEMAQAAARQAAEALQTAQASREVQERQVRERSAQLARQQEELERQARELEQRQAEERRRLERRQAEERKRAAEEAAREQARREAEERRRADQARQRAADEARRVEEARRVRESLPPTYRRDAVVRHTDGRGLFVVTIPSDWSIRETSLVRKDTSSRPYAPSVQFSNGKGAGMSLWLGDAGTRNSQAMNALMATYGASLSAVDRTNYAPMPDPRKLADDFVLGRVEKIGGSDLYYVRDEPCPDLASLQQESLRLFQEAGRVAGGAIVRDPFAAAVLRVYELTLDGVPSNMAVYVRLYAVKDGSGVEYLNPMGLAYGLGSAVGGLFARKRSGSKESKGTIEPPVRSDGSPWSVPDFDAYVREGTIFWNVSGFAMLFSAADAFDRLLEQAFVPLVRTYRVHGDVQALTDDDTRRQAADTRQAANREIQLNNIRTQAALEANRQVQAAFDQRTAEWHRQSDAHHAAFRERTNAEFRGIGAGGGAGDFSEAIRGVNTFVTSDGREVELSVDADRAYENQAGDVIGGSGGFDPGADWTEIPRA